MHNIVCIDCKQKSQVSEEEYKACKGMWTCICKKPIPQGMSIRNCGRSQHTPTYQPKGTYIYNCQACRDEINASRSIKIEYANPEDNPNYQRQQQRDNYVPLPPPKTEVQLLLEEQRTTNKLLSELLLKNTSEPKDLDDK